MLTQKQLDEIKKHLENANNPLFFFDNDVDGLTSFLILQRYFNRGKGVPVKSYPGLNKDYFRKVKELHPDYIFILDKPVVEKEFIDLVKEANLPLVYIDHHPCDNVPEGIENYYNPQLNGNSGEPTSYLCYKATQKKEDMWLAALGGVADYFLPDFLPEFKKQNPELIDYDYKTPFDIYYNTKFGKIIKILAFGLLDRTTNVISMIKFLMKANGPYDVLEENSKTKSFLTRFDFINQKYQVLLEKAGESIDKDNGLLFFTYSGDLSISQELSNELMYKHPDLAIVVVYTKGNQANCSLRGNMDIRKVTLESIKDIEGAAGGGHEHSTGAKMTADNIPKFKENVLRELKKLK